MNRCLISYEECGEAVYSRRGLSLLDKRLAMLHPLSLSGAEQRREALVRAGRMSIQGVQPKLNARLNIRESRIEIVDKRGRYILKPQHSDFPELPENEALTMHLAALARMDVPVNGLLLCRDGTRTYFVKRFDRIGRSGKLHTEDFAQLSGRDRETKYDYSMERIVALIEAHCTFPVVERAKLFRRCLFSYLVGNEDMHLKNFSLIRRDGKVELAPIYDYLNTTIAYQALGSPLDRIEESALPLKGKKKGLTRSDWLDYFGRERLQLNAGVIADALQLFRETLPAWRDLIGISFLSVELKDRYLDLLNDRCRLLGIS